MNHSAQARSTFSFSIAGLGIAVESDDAALVDRLRQRYRLFPHDAGVRLTAYVQTGHNGAETRPTLEPPPFAFEGANPRFTAPGCQGFINAEAGEGYLSLSSAHPLEDVEYFLRVACALLALRAGGLLFHAAGIVRHGRGHLFFGHSGSGKTTIARLSPHDLVLNDDLVLLMPTERQGWQVHATPFWNPTQIVPAGPASAPLAGLFRLVQDRHVYLEKMGPGQAIAELVSNTPVIPAAPAYGGELLETCQRLLGCTPAYRLHFLPDASFWDLVEKQEFPDSPFFFNLDTDERGFHRFLY